MVRTVLLVDDHAGFRELARTLLEEDGYSVVGEATDGLTALAACRRLRPDAVLLDLPPPRVVLTSAHEDERVGSLLRRSGALAFVPKAALANSQLSALWEQRIR